MLQHQSHDPFKQPPARPASSAWKQMLKHRQPATHSLPSPVTDKQEDTVCRKLVSILQPSDPYSSTSWSPEPALSMILVRGCFPPNESSLLSISFRQPLGSALLCFASPSSLGKPNSTYFSRQSELGRYKPVKMMTNQLNLGPFQS
jgi:hypothetical protein